MFIIVVVFNTFFYFGFGYPVFRISGSSDIRPEGIKKSVKQQQHVNKKYDLTP